MDQPIIPTFPGTDLPIPGTIDIDENPELFAPIVVRIVEEIEDAVTVIQGNPDAGTPFSGNPEKERESITQQTIWTTMGIITGHPYERQKTFADNVYEQFETNTGSPQSSSLNEDDKEKIDAGGGRFLECIHGNGSGQPR